MGRESGVYLMEISIAIMCHPSRALQSASLAGQLSDMGLDPVVVEDDGGGLWATASRAWATAKGSNHIVVQDDVILSAGFAEAAYSAIEARPLEIISFFGMKKDIRQAYEKHIRWAACPTVSFAQCLSMPTSMVFQWLDWCDAKVDESYKWDDARLALFALHHSHMVFHTAPCLVEHDLDMKSLSGISPTIGKNRRDAAIFFEDDRAAHLNWGQLDTVKMQGHPLSSYKNWEK